MWRSGQLCIGAAFASNCRGIGVKGLLRFRKQGTWYRGMLLLRVACHWYRTLAACSETIGIAYVLGRGVNTMVSEAANMLMLPMLYGNRFESTLWSDEVERMVFRPQGVIFSPAWCVVVIVRQIHQ